ncbi:MAG: tetratricopeptide repeat protein [Planctomycetota bacterium]
MRPKTVVIIAAMKLVGIAVIVGAVVAVNLPSGSTADGGLRAETAAAGLATSTTDAMGAARTAVTDGEPDQAVAILTPLAEANPADQEIRLALASAYLETDAEEAVANAYDAYVAALAIGPRTAEVEFQAGTLASTLDRPQRAVEHYAMAQTLRPEDPAPALYLGLVQQRLGEIDAAKASLLRAVVLSPDDATPLGALAQIALDENKPGLAADHASKAAAREPTRLEWRLLQARAHNRLGEPERALEACDALGEADRLFPAVASARAAAYGLLRDLAAASDVLAAAAERYPSDPDVLFDAAVWHEKADRLDAAAGFAGRAAILGHPLARSMRDRLRAEAGDG